MSDRSLGEWLRYLEQLHPVDIDLGLARVRVVAQNLNLLPYGPDVITVAGTNGKGSVAYSTDAILRSQGKCTGRYTSPHLLSFNERIAVNGDVVSDAQILEAFTAIDLARRDVTLTYFEFATLAAYWIFKEQGVDVAIMEVGLGGRLDAVNLIDAKLVVITAIDLDHQHWLGDTVEKIAPEKAAVARRGCEVILAEHQYPDSLFRTLDDIGASVIRSGHEWLWSYEAEQLLVCLNGTEAGASFSVPDGLRAANVAAAVQVSARLVGPSFDERAASQALASLRVPARRQLIPVAQRELLLDVAHNPAAMQAMVDYLKSRPISGQTIAALGLMADKDLGSMAGILATGVDGACALAIPGIDRAASPEVIWQALDDAAVAIPQGEFSAEAVWTQLLAGSSPGDRLVVCGSFHSVAGIMNLLNLELPSTSGEH